MATNSSPFRVSEPCRRTASGVATQVPTRQILPFPLREGWGGDLSPGRSAPASVRLQAPTQCQGSALEWLGDELISHPCVGTLPPNSFRRRDPGVYTSDTSLPAAGGVATCRRGRSAPAPVRLQAPTQCQGSVLEWLGDELISLPCVGTLPPNSFRHCKAGANTSDTSLPAAGGVATCRRSRSAPAPVRLQAPTQCQGSALEWLGDELISLPCVGTLPPNRLWRCNAGANTSDTSLPAAGGVATCRRVGLRLHLSGFRLQPNVRDRR